MYLCMYYIHSETFLNICTEYKKMHLVKCRVIQGLFEARTRNAVGTLAI